MDKQLSSISGDIRDEITSRPLVSVVLNFFNAARFIEEAIESVFAQTDDRWELLLVDDGSTDGSTEVALRYAGRHPGKVRYLEHEGHQNRGTSASRNLGIRHAQGEYIAFLDADDVWLAQKLERQVAILGSHPGAAMVYGLDQYWYSWTGNPEDSQRDFVPELGVPPNTLVWPPTLLTLFFFRQEAAIPTPASILVRREVVECLGGFEEVFRGMYDDQALLSKVCLKAPVYVSGECWSRYRQHESSICAVAKKTGQEYAARLFFLNWLAAYLSAQSFKDPKIWRALQKERWLNRHPNIQRLLRRMRQTVRQVKTLHSGQ